MKNGVDFSKISIRVLISIFVFLLIIGCGTYQKGVKILNFIDGIDNYNIVNENINENLPAIFVVKPIGCDNCFKLNSCDPKNLPLQNVHKLSPSSDSWVFNVNELGSPSYYYNQDALIFDNLYNPHIDRVKGKYIKIKRILLKTKLLATENYLIEKDNTTIDYIQIFKSLENKMINSIKENQGDAIMDLCAYLSDYNEINVVESHNITITTFEANLTLTGTIIKFIDNFSPGMEYLLK